MSTDCCVRASCCSPSSPPLFEVPQPRFSHGNRRSCAQMQRRGSHPSSKRRLRDGARLRWTIGSFRRTTRFRWWKITFGCTRSRASAWRITRPQPAPPEPSCITPAQTQRGSLDHLDRIGYYERQNCLVLDAVTVRNLELIEPLFAGAERRRTLFRASIAPYADGQASAARLDAAPLDRC